jgi:hypothetical protein
MFKALKVLYLFHFRLSRTVAAAMKLKFVCNNLMPTAYKPLELESLNVAFTTYYFTT